MSNALGESCGNIDIFDIFRGNDVAYRFETCSEEGAPWDITGWTYLLHIKEKESDPDDKAIITKEFDPINEIDGVEGIFELVIGRGDTALLTRNKYYLTLKLIDYGLHTTVLAGSIKIRGKVNWSELSC